MLTDILLDVPDQGTSSAETLRQINEQLEALRARLQTWHMSAGRVRVSGRFGSMRLAQVFLGFHLLIVLSGGALIFVGGAAQSLGIAMVVGAIFGFGAFIAQVWALQVERERWLVEDQVREEIGDLTAKLEQAMMNQSTNSP